MSVPGMAITPTAPTALRRLAAPVGALLLGMLLATGCTQAAVDPPQDPDRTGPVLDREEQVLIAEDGYRLPYRRWGPEGDDGPKAVVLALHGMNDYSRGMRFAAERLAEHGIATYAYDHRGFGATRDAGLWPGDQALVDDAAAAVALLAEAYPDTPLHLLGHSMGGAVAMVLVTEQAPEAVSSVALLAPAVWGREAMPWYQRSALWLTARAAPGLELSGELVGVEPTDNPEVLEEIATDPHIRRDVRADVLSGVADLMDRALAASGELEARALILYGEHDEVIPPEPTCRMLARLPERPPGQWRLALYPEGYHMLTRDRNRDHVNDDLAAWFLDPAEAELPSGYEVDRAQARAWLCSDP